MPALVSARSFVSLALLLTCGSQAAAQEWRPAAPPAARSGHAMVYDTLRDRTVLFGGSAAGARLNDTWEHDGMQWIFVPTPNSPPARDNHAMAFDSVRGVAVMFGGNGQSGRMNDTWEYDGTTWTPAATPVSPPARYGHVMSHDAVRGVVLFGGFASSYLGDTWEYDGLTWTQSSTTTAPPARMRTAMTYHLSRGAHVLYGGLGTSGALGDTWEYNGTWTQNTTTTTSPGNRSGMSMTFHAGLGALVLFGGLAPQLANDTWLYDGNWIPTSPTAAPPARWAAALAFDVPRNRVLLFGGLGAGSSRFGDVWEYDGTTWTMTQPSTVVRPGARRGGSLAYDAMRRRTVLFGGLENSGSGWQTLADTWEYDGATWTQIPTVSSPPHRAWHGLSYDAARGRVVLYGGGAMIAGQWANRADTWEYDGQDWTQIPTNNSPTGNIGATLAYDLRRRRHVQFGGTTRTAPNTFVPNDETWEYDGQDWTRILTPTHPSARSAALAYDARRGVTVLFGGDAGVPYFVPLNDTWEYDGHTWTQVLTTSAPAPRAGGALAFNAARGRHLLYGGYSGGQGGWFGYFDTWEYDGSSWQMISTATQPTTSSAAAMVYDLDRNRFVRFGGGGPVGSGSSDETWEFVPPEQPSWSGYGTGCAGSFGTPFLSAGSMPIPGTSFVQIVTGLPLNPGILYVARGLDLGQFAGQPLPLDLGAYGLPGCSLWVAPDPALSVGQIYTGVATTVSTPIPNLAAVAGLRFGTQVLALDPLSPNGIGSLTNAGIATIH